MAATHPPSAAFRLAAAALAGVPLGFAGGALLGGRLLTNPSDPAAAGATLACAAFGALLVSGAMVLAVMLLTPKAGRLATLVGGVASIAVVVYAVQDFVGHRMAQARAFDEAYERMPHFDLALTAESASRRPFSKLQFESETGQYTAERPGGWLCQGHANREQTMTLFEGLGHVADGRGANVDAVGACQMRATWQMGGVSGEQCLDVDGQALIAAADTLVDATERRSSCRRLRPGEGIGQTSEGQPPFLPLQLAALAATIN